MTLRDLGCRGLRLKKEAPLPVPLLLLLRLLRPEGFMVSGLELKVFGFRVQDLRFRGVGFRV